MQQQQFRYAEGAAAAASGEAAPTGIAGRYRTRPAMVGQAAERVASIHSADDERRRRRHVEEEPHAVVAREALTAKRSAPPLAQAHDEEERTRRVDEKMALAVRQLRATINAQLDHLAEQVGLGKFFEGGRLSKNFQRGRVRKNFRRRRAGGLKKIFSRGKEKFSRE